MTRKPRIELDLHQPKEAAPTPTSGRERGMKPFCMFLIVALLVVRLPAATAQMAMDGPTAVQTFSGQRFASKTPSGMTLVTLTLHTGKIQQDGSIGFTGELKAEAVLAGGINDKDALKAAVFYPRMNIMRIETRTARADLAWNGQALAGPIRYGPTNFFYTLRKQ
ncbi:MAG: hypothetical protein AB7O82_07135 [Reyranella sp.]